MEKAQLIITELANCVRISLTIPGRDGFVTTADRENVIAEAVTILKECQLGPSLVDVIAPDWVKAELKTRGFGL